MHNQRRMGRTERVWSLTRIAAGAAVMGLALSGCAEVKDPITPEQARAEVMDAARDILNTLHGELTEARFHYESCNDQGEPPFRGLVRMAFWMPGVPHDQPVDPQRVIQPLTAHGWSTDSDFISHSPTLRKDNINIILTVVPRLPAVGKLNSHVGVDVAGQCRDTFDHRSNDSILSVDVHKELQPA
jgi:hypothetical protein